MAAIMDGARGSPPGAASAPLLAGDGEAGHGADVSEVGLLVPGLVADGLHALPRPLQGQLRPADIDVPGPLADVGEHVDPLGQDLAPAGEAGEPVPAVLLAVRELA